MAGCEIYINGDSAKEAFDLLVAQKNAIQKELNCELDWMRLDDKSSCRIISRHPGTIAEPQQRKELLGWFRDAAEKFYRVFAPKIKALKLTGKN